MPGMPGVPGMPGMPGVPGMPGGAGLSNILKMAMNSSSSTQPPMDTRFTGAAVVVELPVNNRRRNQATPPEIEIVDQEEDLQTTRRSDHVIDIKEVDEDFQALRVDENDSDDESSTSLNLNDLV